MYRIDQDGAITMSRGECFAIPLFINAGTLDKPIRTDLRLIPNAQVYLSIYEPNKSFENFTIGKVFTKDNLNENGDIVVNFSRNDTYYALPGKYYYQIKLRIQDEIYGEFINTVIDQTPFNLL